MAALNLGELVNPSDHERTGEAVTLKSEDFTTHGVIVGMTGSGKTGLGVVLIEEVLSAGLPALLVDPKGDLTNLCLTFPALDGASFRPWIDEGQAKAAGQSPDDFAGAQATMWKEGLAGWSYGPDQIQRLRDTCDFTIYTPGSQAGSPINIVGSLQVPDTDDAETISDEIEGYVSGLLGLVDIEADPLSSREHILLANIIHHAWSNGQALDLPALVGQVQQPPLQKLGVFELDQFFPAKDRERLAMQLNGLLASPSFAAWGLGVPLDIQSLLYTADARPRCAIVTTSHLSDEERQFVTSLLLAKVVTWMRRQSGTTDLRVLIYMDEVMGYLPPTEMPPTKRPIMTLMKQARAFGVGVVLATQNPVDIDYKAISNAGTWVVGRLQTERDKKRLLDGMSAADGGVDIGAVSDTISGLDKREFVLRRAGQDAPAVFTSRWAMSYLRGPLTKDQIKQLSGGAAPVVPAHPAPPPAPTETPGAGAPDGEPAAPPAPTETPNVGAPVGEPAAATAPADTAAPVTATTPGAPLAPPTPPAPAPAAAAAPPPDAAPVASGSDPDTTPVMPSVAPGVVVRWVAAGAPWLAEVGGDAGGTVYEPSILARIQLRYDETKADLVHDEVRSAVLFPLESTVDASRAATVEYDDATLLADAPGPVAYRLSAAPISDARTWKKVERDLIDHVVRTGSIELTVNKELKLYSTPGEDTDAFRARCATAAQTAADAEKAAVTAEHQDKAAKLESQREAAEDRASVVEEQAKDRKRGNLLRAAGDVLGGLFGSRRSAAGKIGRAADSLTRNADGERVDEAKGKIGRIDQQQADLDAAMAAELMTVDATWANAASAITTVPIGLERTDVKVTQIALAWIPVP